MILNLDDPKTQGDLADTLDKLRDDLAEVISLDDLQHHEWLRRIIVAADDFTNRVEYRALEWAKCVQR